MWTICYVVLWCFVMQNSFMRGRSDTNYQIVVSKLMWLAYKRHIRCNSTYVRLYFFPYFANCVLWVRIKIYNIYWSEWHTTIKKLQEITTCCEMNCLHSYSDRIELTCGLLNVPQAVFCRHGVLNIVAFNGHIFIQVNWSFVLRVTCCIDICFQV